MADEPNISDDTGQKGEERAFRRAALRAREIAARTGTPLVFYRNGKIEMVPVDESEVSFSQSKKPEKKGES